MLCWDSALKVCEKEAANAKINVSCLRLKGIKCNFDNEDKSLEVKKTNVGKYQHCSFITAKKMHVYTSHANINEAVTHTPAVLLHQVHIYPHTHTHTCELSRQPFHQRLQRSLALLEKPKSDGNFFSEAVSIG